MVKAVLLFYWEYFLNWFARGYEVLQLGKVKTYLNGIKLSVPSTVLKMKFSTKDFFSKYDQMHRKLGEAQCFCAV